MKMDEIKDIVTRALNVDPTLQESLDLAQSSLNFLLAHRVKPGENNNHRLIEESGVAETLQGFIDMYGERLAQILGFTYLLLHQGRLIFQHDKNAPYFEKGLGGFSGIYIAKDCATLSVSCRVYVRTNPYFLSYPAGWKEKTTGIGRFYAFE